MRHHQNRFIACFFSCILLMLSVNGVTAQTDITPPLAAEQIRQSLFNTQIALMGDHATEAQMAFDETVQLYQAVLSPSFEIYAPTLAQNIQIHFDAAQTAIDERDTIRFVSLRSLIYTGLLEGAMDVVEASLTNNDTVTASLWLPLREFRPSTRFIRPPVDATLAVQALSRGILTESAAVEAVNRDLLDTYQAQLMLTLQAADEASRNQFALRLAEETALARGYFNIFADVYAEQRGEDALHTLEDTFDALINTAITSDFEEYAQTRAQISDRMMGFAAVPLSENDLARRAGQFTRYLTLVPIEYARGVRGGVVTNDIEIQEALTFQARAATAFAELQPALRVDHADTVDQIDALLAQILEQIRTVAEPSALQANADEALSLARSIIPESWLASSAESDLDVIRSVLDQITVAAQQGDYRAAESSRLEAYAMLELGIEQRLNAFAPEMSAHIESLFWQGTAEQQGLAALIANQASTTELRSTLTALNTALDEATLLLSAGQAAPAVVVGNAAIIVFREGLEAVLILSSLLASLRTVDQKQYRRPLAIGALVALGATAVTWIVATQILNVLLPLGETLEAIVSIIAIGVLILVTNWFFHKTYWVDWMANFHTRKRQLIKGVAAVTISQSFGLVLLGFTSIYREGFETVLFLQSLVLEAGTSIVLQGVLLGSIATVIVGVITFSLQVRLPYKKMLIVTGVMIGAVLLTMVGHTVHVMQAIGWMPITPIQGVYFPFWMGQWFGLFATWQGIILQIAAATFVIGSYFLAERQKTKHREDATAKHTTPAEVGGD